jgi:hypothetical protein
MREVRGERGIKRKFRLYEYGEEMGFQGAYFLHRTRPMSYTRVGATLLGNQELERFEKSRM